ncbi:sugar ABC transporter permease [Halocella sp. SP3-1]|uniref:carbohydrate ABC transporter permease n=1 Tax=Halocella sp. SP3-1 TaxID=2382161 RepID=UPI00197AE356|nr:sugar ABC transporter permease [Halocella sp. SP3-1]
MSNMENSMTIKRKTNNHIYWFILPFLIFLLILVVYPILKNLILSFQSESGIFVNYVETLKNRNFPKIIFNSFLWTFSSIILQFIIGLSIAFLLKQPVKGKAVFRTIMLVLPWATPDIVAAVAWKWMYNDMYGVFNDLLVKLGLINDYLPWLGFPNLARAGVIIANTWKGFPLSAMFYLAALQTVPYTLYEAADIDGANLWQKFRYITIPIIKPVIITTIMLTTIWSINYFPLIYTMTAGGPINATDTFVTFAYKNAFKFLNFNRAAALANISFIVILMIAISYVIFIFKGEGEPKK